MMLELHIENYKEFLEQKQDIISTEQCKIVEYEQLLLDNKSEQGRRSFFKKFFDKNEYAKINEVTTAIQNATFIITQSKKEIEERKNSLIEYSKNHIISGNDDNSEKNRKLIAEKEAFFEINRVTKEIEDICILSIKSLENSVKFMNELNVAVQKGMYQQDYNINMVTLNKLLGESLASISRFKKAINYSKDQILNYYQNSDVSFYEPLMNIISDDKSENIILRNTLDETNKYISTINNTLSVIHASYKLVKNLNEKHTKRYIEKEAELSNYSIDIELIAKKRLKDSGIKL